MPCRRPRAWPGTAPISTSAIRSTSASWCSLSAKMRCLYRAWSTPHRANFRPRQRDHRRHPHRQRHRNHFHRDGLQRYSRQLHLTVTSADASNTDTDNGPRQHRAGAGEHDQRDRRNHARSQRHRIARPDHLRSRPHRPQRRNANGANITLATSTSTNATITATTSGATLNLNYQDATQIAPGAMISLFAYNGASISDITASFDFSHTLCPSRPDRRKVADASLRRWFRRAHALCLAFAGQRPDPL